MANVYLWQYDIPTIFSECVAASAKVVKVVERGYQIVVETSSALTNAEHKAVANAIRRAQPRLMQEKLNPGDPDPPAPPPVPPPEMIPLEAAGPSLLKFGIQVNPLGVLSTISLP